MFRRIFNSIKSLKLTALVILCLTTVFLLGLIIPQKALLGKDAYPAWKENKPGLVGFLEFLGFTDIYVSPLALALLSVFFLNLAAIMSSRIPAIWRRCFNLTLPGGVSAINRSGNYRAVEGIGIEDVRRNAERAGYGFFSSGDSFLAVKNRFSPMGTILFHMSFFLLLVGGVATFYTKFTAEAALAVGETFDGNYTRMALPKIGGIPSAFFRVEDVRPAYYKRKVPVDLKVVLSTKTGDKTIGINKPFREGPLTFVITQVDVAPLFVLMDGDGNELDGAYVKLRALRGKEDVFDMGGYEFKAVFHTDADMADSVEPAKESTNLPEALKQPFPEGTVTQYPEIVAPAFSLAVSKEGSFLGSKTIRPGQFMEFDGMKLVFEDLTYWLKFYVVRERGLWMVYSGFALMVAALILRFGFYRRDIKGVMEAGVLHMAGRGEYFPAFFAEEFDAIARKHEGAGGGDV